MVSRGRAGSGYEFRDVRVEDIVAIHVHRAQVGREGWHSGFLADAIGRPYMDSKGDRLRHSINRPQPARGNETGQRDFGDDGPTLRIGTPVSIHHHGAGDALLPRADG